VVWIQNLTLTQWFTLVKSPGRSPLQNPTTFVTAFWSLNYEEQFYLFAALLLLLPGRKSRMATMIALMPLSLYWRVDQPFTYRGIFIEYWLHFGFGCLVFWRLCRMSRSNVTWVFDSIIAAAALASTYIFFQSGMSTNPPLLIQEMPVVCWFSLLLILLRSHDQWLATSVVGRLLAPLGTISYSLYLIHENNLALCRTVAGHLVSTNWTMLNQFCQLALHIGIAAVFWYFCERPFLNSRLANARHDSAPTTAQHVQSG
jgi:peptidoglycan/LPS O-acetylase OafA/YrhL